MRTYTKDKLVIIELMNKIKGINGIKDLIKEYAFTDIKKNIKKFKELHCNTLDIIKNAYSRKSLNIPDDDGHWLFGIASESIALQRINCVICGEFTREQNIPDKCICLCYFPELEEDDEHDNIVEFPNWN